MAELRVEIAGRSYRLGCEDGQESHLAELAAKLDAEARSIAGKSVTVPEGRLLVMCALSIADQLAEAEAARTALAARVEALEASGIDPEAVAVRVNQAAARLARLAETSIAR
ncbi:MAG: cell division protein ZapA [Pseudomonadota bacterium]